jgi:hypothetical protein
VGFYGIAGCVANTSAVGIFGDQKGIFFPVFKVDNKAIAKVF